MATTTSWKGGNGQWQVAANWSNGAPTTPQSTAVIDAAGTYTVSIGRGLEYSVGAIVLNDAHATLSIAGILNLTNKLTVSKGRLVIGSTIDGGSIVAAGGKIAFQNGTLDGVKFLGPLNLSTGKVTVKDGLTLRNTAGTGPGAFTLSGTGQIDFAGDQTIDGGTWTITGGTVAQTATLTLGASEDVEYKAAKSAFAAKASLVVKGKFDIGKGASLSVGQVANSSKLTVNAGGVFSAATFTNNSAGSVAIYSGSVFKSNSFNNAGTFSADSSTVSLIEAAGGSFGNLAITNSKVQLGAITSAAELSTLETMLSGQGNSFTADLSLNNNGKTTSLGTPSGFSSFAYSGRINGGRVSIGPQFSGRLTKLTYLGTANVAGTLLATGVTFAGTGGAGSATMNLNGHLRVATDSASSTLNDVNIVATSHSAIAGVRQFTLGGNVTLKAEGDFTLSILKPAGGTDGDLLTNNGVIEADGGAGTVFNETAKAILNNGTIRVADGGVFNARNFRNVTGHTLVNGTYDIGVNAKLVRGTLTYGITTLQATVIYEGAGATFLSPNLAVIGAQGSLSLENGATQAVASQFIIDGALDLAGSPFTCAKIAVDAGGRLDGYGTVFGAVANSGTIDAFGGTLSISQGVTGTGVADIENNATLSFGAGVAAGQTVTFEGAAGTLALGNAGGFAGTIAGFAPGNAIDLINTKASAVTYNAGADTLTVKSKGTVIATLQLSGSYTGDTFGLASDGKGGTEITVSAATPAVHRFIEAVAAFSRSGAASAGIHAAPDIGHLTPVTAANHAHFG